MDTTETTHISLCSGYGGIDLGLKRVLPNLRTVALCEIEAFACANLVAKMEAGLLDPAPIWTDLKTFPWEQFSGLVDIFSGGYPCQPFSAAGLRKGTEDPRHLWPFISSGIQVAFKWHDPVCVFSRMWKDTLALDLEKSLQTWKALVIKRRGEYSQRLKLTRLTSGKESFSLPTPCANEDSFRLNGNTQQSKCLEAKARRGELGKAGPLNPQFVEIMMGLPIGWTDCAFLATESSQQQQL